jgi:predicted PurR-regulated permease PerM
VQDVLDEVQRKIGWYLRGVAINSVVVGALSGAADWLIGAPYPLILGVLAGTTELIPYFGPWISGGVAVLVTLLTGQVVTALVIVVAYVLIQQIEGHVLIPYVMMRVVEVNPLIVVLSTLLGFMLLGLIGGILAVPAASIIHVLTVRVVAPAIRSHTHRGEDEAEENGATPGREAARDERATEREAGGEDFVVGPRRPAAT